MIPRLDLGEAHLAAVLDAESARDSPVPRPVAISERVLIGSSTTAQSLAELSALGVTTVINLSPETNLFRASLSYTTLDFRDGDSSAFEALLYPFVEAIENALNFAGAGPFAGVTTASSRQPAATSPSLSRSSHRHSPLPPQDRDNAVFVHAGTTADLRLSFFAVAWVMYLKDSTFEAAANHVSSCSSSIRNHLDLSLENAAFQTVLVDWYRRVHHQVPTPRLYRMVDGEQLRIPRQPAATGADFSRHNGVGAPSSHESSTSGLQVALRVTMGDPGLFTIDSEPQAAYLLHNGNDHTVVLFIGPSVTGRTKSALDTVVSRLQRFEGASAEPQVLLQASYQHSSGITFSAYLRRAGLVPLSPWMSAGPPAGDAQASKVTASSWARDNANNNVNEELYSPSRRRSHSVDLLATGSSDSLYKHNRSQENSPRLPGVYEKFNDSQQASVSGEALGLSARGARNRASSASPPSASSDTGGSRLEWCRSPSTSPTATASQSSDSSYRRQGSGMTPPSSAVPLSATTVSSRSQQSADDAPRPTTPAPTDIPEANVVTGIDLLPDSGRSSWHSRLSGRSMRDSHPPRWGAATRLQRQSPAIELGTGSEPDEGTLVRFGSTPRVIRGDAPGSSLTRPRPIHAAGADLSPIKGHGVDTGEAAPPSIPLSLLSGASEVGGGAKDDEANLDEREVWELRRRKLARCETECSRVRDHLYLGGAKVACDQDKLKAHGITHIVNCAADVTPNSFPENFRYFTLFLLDSPHEDILASVYDVVEFVESARAGGGRVLIHCVQGVSRSCALAVAVLVLEENLAFDTAMSTVKAARAVARPNIGFELALMAWCDRVHASAARQGPENSNGILYRVSRQREGEPRSPLVAKRVLLSDPSLLHISSDARRYVLHARDGRLHTWLGDTDADPDGEIEVVRATVARLQRYEHAGPRAAAYSVARGNHGAFVRAMSEAGATPNTPWAAFAGATEHLDLADSFGNRAPTPSPVPTLRAKVEHNGGHGESHSAGNSLRSRSAENDESLANSTGVADNGSLSVTTTTTTTTTISSAPSDGRCSCTIL